jgi:hypothetical protein
MNGPNGEWNFRLKIGIASPGTTDDDVANNPVHTVIFAFSARLPAFQTVTTYGGQNLMERVH